MINFKQSEPLLNHCTYRIGGPADYFFEAKSIQDLQEAIKQANDSHLPFIVFAGGSNILFSDKGFRGLAIKITADKITTDNDKAEITADAGVTIPQLIKVAEAHNLSGLSPWHGLPGTVGGAVRGNAGCNGLETSQILKEAQILDPKSGKTETTKPRDLDFSYRHSKLKNTNEIVLQATFKLKKDHISASEQAQIKSQIRTSRSEKQPPGFSTGSFFKNPSPDQPAGLLIDKAGLKGKRIGKAQISPLHGNFILNLGGATAADIIALKNLAKEEVKAKFDINLEEEVQIIPERLA